MSGENTKKPAQKASGKKPDAQKASVKRTGGLAALAADITAGVKDLTPTMTRKSKNKSAKTKSANNTTNKAAGVKTKKRKSRKAKAPLHQRFLRESASVLSSLFFVAMIGGLYVVFMLVAPTGPDGEDLWAVNRLPSIVILDRNGDEIASRGARYGEAVSIDELPPFLIKAFLATEDRRFYEHRGVDIRGLTRAAFANMKAGGVVEGGSTITQQLAKNLFLSPEQTYIRKAREAMLALWLEGRYTKDEILSLYLNRIYMGAGAYGIESASLTYFGKSARDVTLSEAVMLAGLPKAPSTLAPTQNPFGAQDRAFEVLDNLRETGAVSAFAAREARLNPPVVASANADADLGYFFDYAAAKARKIAGPDAIDLIVHTTIDPKMQRAAEAAVNAVISVDTVLDGAEQAALIAYDNSGALRAMVGGKSYLESQFNRSTQSMRQPGSAFKPFVYVAGMEAGLSPQSRFVDQPVNINGWEPNNYGEKYRGPMRLSEAMAKSINSIAVQVSERVGRRNVANAATRMGIISPVPAHPSVALGATNLTLHELTGAYLTFARGGMSAKPHAILKVTDQAGTLYYQHSEQKPERVLARGVAKNMNHLLYQVIHNGTGRRASLGARVAAGKTGTTNDWRDAWFVGYTAQVTAGVWVGNDAYAPMKKITGGSLPAEIWKNFMTTAHQGLPRRKLDGAYPAATYADENALISFYGDVSRDLRRVRRDGRERRPFRRRN